MSFVTNAELLVPRPEGFAVGAFNVHNMEEVQGVIQAAEECQAPVIIQVSESALKHAGITTIAAIVRVMAETARVPVALHLDHGHSFELVVECIRAGFSSVMIDGSSLSFQANIELTRKVVEVAHACGVSVEAELGKVGGKEDNINLALDQATLTNPEQAAEFVERTGIDVFAPAIGTVHGLYQGEPNLDFERLRTIRKLVAIPLALHGGSDIPDALIKQVILDGIDKINIGTEIKYATTNAIRKIAAEHPEEFETRVFMGYARASVCELVKKKIRLFGAEKRV